MLGSCARVSCLLPHVLQIQVENDVSRRRFTGVIPTLRYIWQREGLTGYFKVGRIVGGHGRGGWWVGRGGRRGGRGGRWGGWWGGCGGRRGGWSGWWGRRSSMYLKWVDGISGRRVCMSGTVILTSQVQALSKSWSYPSNPRHTQQHTPQTNHAGT